MSGLAGVAFIWRSLASANPIVDLRALKDRNFALGCFFSFVTGIGLFATIYLTPLFLGRVRGFSALDIGLAIFSTGVFQLAAIPFYAYLANRVDLRWLMMTGLAPFAISMWDFSPITHDWGAAQLLLPQALRGIAQQFAVPPTVTLTLGSLAPARLKRGLGRLAPALAVDLSRGTDADLLRYVSGDHGLLHHRHGDGAVDAQDRTACGAFGGCALRH